LTIDFKILLLPGIITLISVLLLLILRSVTFRFLSGLAGKTEVKIDDIIIKSIKIPSIYWCIIIGIYIGVSMSELPKKYILYFSMAIHVLVILSITIAAANITGRIFRDYIQKSNLNIPTTGLFYGILKGSILLIGFLILLSTLGISITPLITALGIGGLAVALALQDTLSNLFAGIHILIEKSIRVGDFIKLESGQEGYVEDITWRTTRVRMLPNNMVVIPNNKLAQSIVMNYYLPDKIMTLSIPVRVGYESDPDKIEYVLIDEAKKAVGEVAGLIGNPEPVVRFIPGFGESSLDFTLLCQIDEFTDQYLIQHELRKRIFRRFNEEGIDIPFPHRTVYLKKEKE